MCSFRRAIVLVGLAAAFLLSGCWGWGVERTSWQLTEPPSGTELHIGVWVGGCDSFDTMTVRETEEDVSLQGYIGNDTETNCDDILRFDRKTVQLREPLGDRPLLGCNPSDAVYRLPEGTSNEACASAIRRES